jgi:hypothetical protein
VADMVRLETLATDNGTLVDGHRVAETNLVRDRRANISQFYGGKWKEWSWKWGLRRTRSRVRFKGVGSSYLCDKCRQMPRKAHRLLWKQFTFGLKKLSFIVGEQSAFPP